MAQPASTPDPHVRTPTVLVVLVVRNAAGWLRETLRALGAQTYPRLALLAVDNASNDGSGEALDNALGSGRVLHLKENAGVAGAIRAALEHPVAKEADHTLVLHDDTALDPDAVEKLVDAAVGIEGVEGIGIVGPKVVDWDDPTVLREVGRSTDRFGHPYTPLQDGEIDQGQYDRVLEVLFVSSCAMLVSADVWRRVGPPDERLESHHEDLDLCWRARVAGFRVVMTPLARARHMDATRRGLRGRDPHRRGSRYYAERAALASMLKNYALRSLAWVLPLYVAIGLFRILGLTLARRFEELVDLLASWGWNIVHLPSTLRRRVRSQSVRTVSDRSIRRFMESSGVRIPRWFEQAGVILAEQAELEREDEGEGTGVRLRHQTTSLMRSHPVVVASFLTAVVLAVAYRSLVGPGPLQGASIALFPGRPDGFFAELLSAYRTTGLGGSQAGSPALGALGALSTLLFGSTGLAQKVMLGGAPVLGGVMTYRGLARQTGKPISAVIAAACYPLSAVMLWGFSEGRMDFLVALAVLPVLYDRFEAAFTGEAPVGGWRFIVGMGVALAVATAFFPGILPAVAVLFVVRFLFAPARLRGTGLAIGAGVVAAALLFPMIPGLVDGGGAALSSQIGTTRMSAVARLALGSGPGTWTIAWFLPVAAAVAFSLVTLEDRGRAMRAFLSAAAGTLLAWTAAAGYLPRPLSNPMGYAGLAAVSEAMLVGYGLAALSSGIGKESFGYRQIGAAAISVVLFVGLGLQVATAMVGGWAFGGTAKATPEWQVLRSSAEGEYRVLWIGANTARPFAPPGGDPQGVIADGTSSLRWGFTNQDGALAIDTGRALTGPGEQALQQAMDEILSGSTIHGGALLAPLGVRFVVAAQGDLPAGAARLLGEQVDLDLVSTQSLIVYRDAVALPPAGVVADPSVAKLAASSSPEATAELPEAASTPLFPVGGGWTGQGTGAGSVMLGYGFSPNWRLESASGTVAGTRAFGWATTFAAPSGAFRIRYADQWVRTSEIVLLGALWLIALWITRKPAAR